MCGEDKGGIKKGGRQESEEKENVADQGSGRSKEGEVAELRAFSKVTNDLRRRLDYATHMEQDVNHMEGESKVHKRLVLPLKKRSKEEAEGKGRKKKGTNDARRKQKARFWRPNAQDPVPTFARS